MTRGRAAFALTVLACSWLIFLVPAAALLPSGTEETSTGTGFVSRASTTLVQSNGSWVLFLMAVPAALGLVAWFGLYRRCKGRASQDEMLVWLPIGLLCAFSILGALSVGWFVFPAALALGFAGAITPQGQPGG